MARPLPIKKLTSHHFARFGEFIVSFELLKRNWNTYTPIYDKRIDLIAHKFEHGESKFRTIQIRSSRLVNGEKKFGFKIYPEDLIDDSNHFLIVFGMGNRGKLYFLIMSVEDYKKVMGNSLNTQSFKKRKYRHHVNIKTFKEGKKDFSPFLNKFDKLK